MPTFRYTTLARGNGPISAGGGPGGSAAAAMQLVEAPDRAAAIRLLVQRGETPTRVEELTGDAAETAGPVGEGLDTAVSGSGLFKRVMSKGEMAGFIRELATAVQAGLPLVPALRTLARQGRTAPQKAMLASLIEGVETGQTLSDSMKRFGRPFTDLVVNLVYAGEQAGRLGEVLAQAAKLLDRDVKLRRSLVGALTYPAIIFLAVSIAVIVVVTVIVPRVMQAVSGQLLVMPLPTRVVQAVAAFFGSYWWLVIGGAAAAAFIWTRLYSQPGPRLAIDRFTLRIPVLGAMVRDVAVARFTRTFGTLAAAGLPVLQALRITRGTLGNKAMEAAIDEVCDRVGSGQTISEPMERSGYFPPLLVQITNLGERTGKLDEMLLQAADAFEEKTESSIKLFTSILPPILIVVLAGVVGFVVLSIILPLLSLQESIG
ncbi:MAG: type II secretion system F family protein, partial [Phycisphaerales bacterium]|nr:type II secretion system F family protein [Phycisphaerales bacterium]